jgi:hypothetical protein
MDPIWKDAVDGVLGRAPPAVDGPWEALRLVSGANGSAYPLLAPDDVEMRAPLGPVEGARSVSLPVVLCDGSHGQLSPQARLAMLQAAARTGAALRLADPGPDLVELASELGVPLWVVLGPRRTAMTVEAARTAAVVEIQLADVSVAGTVVRSVDAMDGKGSLAGAVTAVRALAPGAQVWVGLRPGASSDALRAAATSGASGVLAHGRTRASPLRRWTTGPDTPAALSAARRAVGRIKPPEGAVAPLLAIAGGLKDGFEVAKALALGARLVVMATAPRIALGCELCGGCEPGQCAPAPADGWRGQADRLTAHLFQVRAQAASALAQAGCARAADATTAMLEATTYDAAATTGVALAGYGEPLPMWLH